MAYREYHRESSEVYGSSISLLDGVPFKISSAFKPPTKVHLPSTLMRKTRSSSTIRHEDYSFEIEEGVLQWADERQRQLEAQKREEEERKQLANQIREQESQSSSDSEPEDKWPASHQSSCSPLPKVSAAPAASVSMTTNSVSLRPVIAGLSGNEILTPTPIHSDTNNRHSNTVSQNVDITQFDNVDDPFDMFERQTLNDIEELKSVFSTPDNNVNMVFSTAGGGNCHTNHTETESCYVTECVKSNDLRPNGLVADSHEHYKDTGEYVQLNKWHSEPATSQVDHLPPITETKAFLLANIPLPPIGSPSIAPTDQSCYDPGASASLHNTNQNSVPIYENIEPPYLYENVQIQNNQVRFNVNKYTRNDLNSPCKTTADIPAPKRRPNYVNMMPQGLTTADTILENGPRPTGMRNALSSPDISGISSLDIQDYDNAMNVSPVFSRSPPPRPSSQQDLTVGSCDVKSVTWNKYQPLPDAVPSLPVTVPGSYSSRSSSSSDLASPSEVDPYLRLSPKAQHAVDNLVSMGFSKPRASRAVERFGEDEKEVIDHLCGVNKLSEDGFDTHHAETILLLYNNNVDKAEKYLNIFKQFKELGFSHDKIKEALVTSNLDREKALDYLTT